MRWMVAVVAACGCGFSVPNGPAGDAGRDAVDDAPVDSAPAPDAGACASVGPTCASDTVLRDCQAVGQLPVDRTCTWGCSTTGTVHCAVVVPSGGAVTAADLDPTGLADVNLQGTIDGNTGAISGVRAAGTGVVSGIGYEVKNGVAVFRFKSLRVIGAVALGGTRPIAFAVDGSVDVDAIIDVRGAPACDGRLAGPGGGDGGLKNDPGSGMGAGDGMSNNDEGGGGGAHGGNGGDGGGASNGGTAFGDARISVLRGGGGGGGGGGGNNAGEGGGGGGAFQIVSNTVITIGAAGGIHAGGCAGTRGEGGNDGGGGGGAGGAILLEAPAVRIAGKLAVNGGSGGVQGNMTANDGRDATLDRSPALGGTSGGTTGGAGAAANVIVGGNATGITGGGGGGAGRIRFHTRTGATEVAGTAVLSPALSDTPTTCTQGAATVQ